MNLIRHLTSVLINPIPIGLIAIYFSSLNYYWIGILFLYLWFVSILSTIFGLIDSSIQSLNVYKLLNNEKYEFEILGGFKFKLKSLEQKNIRLIQTIRFILVPHVDLDKNLNTTTTILADLKLLQTL